MPLNDMIGWTVIALVFAPIIIGMSMKAPKMIALPLIAILIIFSSSTWGQLQVTNTVYSRGTGLFYFSLINIVLLVAGIGLLMRKLANPYSQNLAPPLSTYFVGFSALLIAHILVGLMLGVDLVSILSYTGAINVFNMLIFMYLLITAVRGKRDQQKLLYLIVALAASRAVFGIVRFIWFDGDGANPYRNFEGIDLKIVFFDIADNFVASLAAFWAAWMLTSSRTRLSRFKRLALYGVLLLEIATVALSFRRSSLIGLVFMFIFLWLRMPKQNRAQFTLMAGGILIFIAFYFFQQRLQHEGHATGNFVTSLFSDITPPENGAKSDNRLYELTEAAKSLDGNWLTGIGTWGSFHGDENGLDYHFGKFDFVHSGFGHIILKTGLIGLLLFGGIFFRFTRYYLKHCESLTGTSRFISDAGFAGFLFWIPTLMVGTPIIEFRSMLLLGLTLALPFIAVRIQRRYTQNNSPDNYVAT
jgi:hypothetical protein